MAPGLKIKLYFSLHFSIDKLIALLLCLDFKLITKNETETVH